MSKKSNIYRRITPYFIVVHSPSGKSAVYNRNYEKLFEGASDRLIAYARTHNTQITSGFRLTLPEQQPTWMRPELEDECVGYHTYNDGSTMKEINSVPES